MPDRRAPSKSAREVASRSDIGGSGAANGGDAEGRAWRRRRSAPGTARPGPQPKFEHHDARHEHTLIAAAIFQMTASSPCGTFSPAELTEVRVITRYITRPRALEIAVIYCQTADLAFTRSTAECTARSNCANSAAHCSAGSCWAGTIPAPVPRTVPRWRAQEGRAGPAAAPTWPVGWHWGVDGHEDLALAQRSWRCDWQLWCAWDPGDRDSV